MRVANKRTAGRWTVPVLVLAMAALPGSAAYARGGHEATGTTENSEAAGGRQDRNLTVQTKIQTTVNGARESAKTGTLTPADSNWDPPACWYEPAYSPKQIQATVKAIRQVGMLGIGELVGGVFDSYFKEGHPYKNYNLDKQGEGQFWAATINEKRKNDPEANSCNKLPFWVDKGETPKEPLAVSPRILAEYAYDELPVPSTDIELAPEGTTKVNLPTWAWLDKAKFKKVSVTASIPGSGLSATTTAEPVSLSIDPGTEDAETYPASGECPIEGGKIGVPRAKGTPADTDPPCGVKYLRSSDGDSYDLRATVTWKISWTSTTGEGGNLPDGRFGADQQVEVEEVQSINR
ncbi:hypothetical protein [Streptomyces venezuelae]|uniref:hypothetical protein n=1 Tax=Streptomyces venezuelae TaxID=54571 RepID=UPI001CC24C1A|nr:hypothetical protein [Streptomyces venezuelae]